MVLKVAFRDGQESNLERVHAGGFYSIFKMRILTSGSAGRLHARIGGTERLICPIKDGVRRADLKS
jgi:hypothetical protein